MIDQAPPPQNSREVELKLSIAPSQHEKLKRHPALREISPHRAVVSELDALYFDTPDLKLQEKGIALRLRQSAGRWVQTLKSKGSSAAGLHSRTEWEYPREAPELSFEELPDPALKAYLSELLERNELTPVFKTRFSRWARLLVLPNGTQIELALDHGTIEAGESTESISEVELELKSGHPSALFELALSLSSELVLYPEIRSKAERGYGLFTGIKLKPIKAQIPKLDRHLHPRVATGLFIHAATEQLQRNIEGAILGRDPEFIHQARVALRRLRATFGIFRALLPTETANALRNELRWLMGELGPARDWDVFLESTLPSLQAALPGEPGLAWLENSAQKVRETAQQRAAAALLSSRTPIIILQLGALACQLAEPAAPPETDGVITEPTPESALDLTSFARAILRKRARRAGVDAESLAEWDTEARHAWRITLKKLRYSGDFLAPVFGKRGRTRRWIDALAELQEILGTLNDAATTDRLIESLKPRTRPQREIAATLRGFTSGTVFVRLQDLESAREQLEKSPGPWKR